MNLKTILQSIAIFFLATPSSYAMYELLEGPADAGLGATQWSNNCQRCHHLRSPSEFTPDQWRNVMLHMNTLGGLTGQESRNIYAFLTASTQASTETVAMETDKSSRSGEDVYNHTCIACHGKNGKGAIPGVADFTQPNGPLSKSDHELLNHIEHGYQSPGKALVMPPKGGDSTLTKDEIKNVLKYIRENFGKG